MARPRITMYRGDDRTFPMTLTAAGDPIDLTDCTVRFTAKRAITDTDADAVITVDPVDVTGALTGEVEVTIPAADTIALTEDTKLVWDIEVTDGSGNVRTFPDATAAGVSLGILVIRQDVTQTP